MTGEDRDVCCAETNRGSRKNSGAKEQSVLGRLLIMISQGRAWTSNPSRVAAARDREITSGEDGSFSLLALGQLPAIGPAGACADSFPHSDMRLE